LKEINYQNHQWEHLLFNDSASLEFSVVDKGQVIFFNPILYSEEETYEKADKRIGTTKNDPKGEYYDCMRLKIPQIICKIIDKLLFNLSIFLFSLVAYVLDRLDEIVRDIKKLDSIRN
jgi:hypothetical protein